MVSCITFPTQIASTWVELLTGVGGLVTAFFAAAYGLRQAYVANRLHRSEMLQSILEKYNSEKISESIKIIESETLAWPTSMIKLPDALRVGENALKNFYYYDESARVSRLRKLSNEMIEGTSEFRNGVIPVDLPSNNERILAQNGLFVLPANFEGFEPNLIKTLGVEKRSFCKGMENVDLKGVEEISKCKRLACVKFVIEGRLGKDVERLLKAANITPRTIYSDVSGVVPFVRY